MDEARNLILNHLPPKAEADLFMDEEQSVEHTKFAKKIKKARNKNSSKVVELKQEEKSKRKSKEILSKASEEKEKTRRGFHRLEGACSEIFEPVLPALELNGITSSKVLKNTNRLTPGWVSRVSSESMEKVSRHQKNT